MENDDTLILSITIVGICLLFLIVIINYYDLTKFKECYDNNFNLNWCEKYKNY